MKKQYVKPAMFSEAFDICDSIAAGCGIAVGPTRDTCSYSDPTVPDIKFFIAGGACNMTPGPGDDNNQVCYHVYTPETALFDS